MENKFGCSNEIPAFNQACGNTKVPSYEFYSDATVKRNGIHFGIVIYQDEKEVRVLNQTDNKYTKGTIHTFILNNGK